MLYSLLMPPILLWLVQEQQIESHDGRIKSLEKELEEHKAYRSENVGRKAKSNQVSIIHGVH